MDREQLVVTAYQIATLTYPSSAVLDMLLPLPYERVLELLLIMRQSPRPVKSPLNFLRRAIDEGWIPETMPQKIDRHMENIEEQYYLRRGYTREEARIKVLQNRNIQF